MVQNKDDEKYMRLSLGLARRGVGRTSPNPMVGAVVVKGTTVVGRGYHHRAGKPHAEVLALRRAGEKARGSNPLPQPGTLRPLWQNPSLYPGDFGGGDQTCRRRDEGPQSSGLRKRDPAAEEGGDRSGSGSSGRGVPRIKCLLLQICNQANPFGDAESGDQPGR